MEHRLTYQGKPIWFSVMGMRRNFIDRISAKKEYQPRVESRLNRDHWLLFADFDVLPEAFGSWELLREYLEMLPIHVFKSFSGKPKAVLLVQSSSMSTGKAIDTIKAALGEAADGIDKQGVLHSYICPKYFEAMQTWLDSAEPIEAISDRSYWRFKNIQTHAGISSEENLVLKFAASYEKEGSVALPQAFISQEVGLSLTKVNKAIKRLIARRMLRVVDKSYSPGREAMRYEVIAVHLALRGNLQGIVFREPPVFIQDGTWFTTIWACTNLFASSESFFEWLDGLRGLTMARRKKATASWNAHARRSAA